MAKETIAECAARRSELCAGTVMENVGEDEAHELGASRVPFST